MQIEYAAPLSQAWDRMKQALFHPFNLGKWFTIGFTAFLADLMEGHGGSNGSNWKGGSRFDFNDLAYFPQHAWRWLNNNEIWFFLILLGLAFLITIIVIFTWLSSRGKFMFLYNIVKNDAKVVLPWREYRQQGNSLFLWRLVFGFIFFAAVIGYLIVAFVTVVNIHDGYFGEAIRIFPIIGLIFGLLLIVLAGSYIELFLDNFVVPIMYKHKCGAVEGWKRFLEVFSKHIGHFILYGIFVFLLSVAVIILVILAGIFTCCIGILLILIPYINAVVLLPVSYTFRAFGAEYLRQFGAEFDVFPKKAKA